MSYPTAPPPYNPNATQQQGSAVGFEQYQQGSAYPPPPPPYSTHPYQQAPYPQQQYGHYQPYGQPHHVYTEQPKTVYVYDDQHNRRRNDNDAAECFLWGLCAACLCCCLLDS